MMKFCFVFLIFCSVIGLKAQKVNNMANGKVSYMSSQNVYVKFESTSSLKIGDTLYIQKDNKNIPVLVINNLSSTSCVCTKIATVDLAISTQVIGKKNPVVKEDLKTKEIVAANNVNSSDTVVPTEVKKVIDPKFAQKISGSVSASSYTNLSKSSDFNSTRLRYQFSLNARNIANSKISFETYMSFNHFKNDWTPVKENIFNALKIYNFAVKFDNYKNTQIVLGRKINPKLSSMGAVDGLQYEGNFNKFFVGVIVGSRPNYKDYSFDFNLLQFGTYFGHNYDNTNGQMQNSIAIVEQMNASKTDRRFIYFQHSNSLGKNLYLFGSTEVDLYKNINDTAQNTFDLSSAYLLLSYKMFRSFTLSTSYDNRKNIIYYESYKSFINQLLETEARQGLSLQAVYSGFKNISFGAKAGYRFANCNSKETKDLYAFISYYNIPTVKLNVTLSGNYLESSYVKGKIGNLTISQNSLEFLNFDLGYQFVDYNYIGTLTSSIQHVVNLSVSLNLHKNISFTANYEYTFEKDNNYSRLNLQIRQRF
jgi:hypothetical protein